MFRKYMTNKGKNSLIKEKNSLKEKIILRQEKLYAQGTSFLFVCKIFPFVVNSQDIKSLLDYPEFIKFSKNFYEYKGISFTLGLPIVTENNNNEFVCGLAVFYIETEKNMTRKMFLDNVIKKIELLGSTLVYLRPFSFSSEYTIKNFTKLAQRKIKFSDFLNFLNFFHPSLKEELLLALNKTDKDSLDLGFGLLALGFPRHGGFRLYSCEELFQFLRIKFGLLHFYNLGNLEAAYQIAARSFERGQRIDINLFEDILKKIEVIENYIEVVEGELVEDEVVED